MTLPQPWLITISPLVIPHENRAELSRLAHGLTPDEFVEKIWERRAAEHPPLPRVKRRRMIFPLAAKASNVHSIKRVR